MQQAFGLVSQVVLAFALPYFAISIVLGIRVARRDGRRLRSQESGGDERPEKLLVEGLYFLVPCLNEEVVIGATVSRLLSEPGCTVVVIDDGSTDRTAQRARESAAECGAQSRLIVLTRSGADSRCGKGAALNAAFPIITCDVAAKGLDPNDVIVAVMDADGRLSHGAVRAALKPFDDPRVGGVQLIVSDPRPPQADRSVPGHRVLDDLRAFAVRPFDERNRELGGNGQFTRPDRASRYRRRPVESVPHRGSRSWSANACGGMARHHDHATDTSISRRSTRFRDCFGNAHVGTRVTWSR